MVRTHEYSLRWDDKSICGPGPMERGSARFEDNLQKKIHRGDKSARAKKGRGKTSKRSGESSKRSRESSREAERVRWQAEEEQREAAWQAARVETEKRKMEEYKEKPFDQSHWEDIVNAFGNGKSEWPIEAYSIRYLASGMPLDEEVRVILPEHRPTMKVNVDSSDRMFALDIVDSPSKHYMDIKTVAEKPHGKILLECEQWKTRYEGSEMPPDPMDNEDTEHLRREFFWYVYHAGLAEELVEMADDRGPAIPRPSGKLYDKSRWVAHSTEERKEHIDAYKSFFEQAGAVGGDILLYNDPELYDFRIPSADSTFSPEGKADLP